MPYVHQTLYGVGKYCLPAKWFQLLEDKSMDVELLQHHITLNSETRADLRWCLDFLPSWKGSSPLVELDWTHFDLSTDASSIDYGAHWQGRWFFGS